MEAARTATAGDLDRLDELATAAWAELSDERGGALWALREAPPNPRRPEFATAIDRPDQLLVVGTVQGYTVGYGSVRLEPLRDGRPLAVVRELFVEPPFRGVAVGEALMDAMIDWARSLGAAGIDSIALPGMRETKNFFERYGMKARALLVHRPFDEPDAGATTAGDDDGR